MHCYEARCACFFYQVHKNYKLDSTTTAAQHKADLVANTLTRNSQNTHLVIVETIPGLHVPNVSRLLIEVADPRQRAGARNA